MNNEIKELKELLIKHDSDYCLNKSGSGFCEGKDCDECEAEYLFTHGYRNVNNIKLTAITDDVLASLPMPTNDEIEKFLANPDNQMGTIKDSTILKIAAQEILFAKSSIQAQLAHTSKEIKGE
jgi:hypothetical protein